jgi:hypothetical protein
MGHHFKSRGFMNKFEEQAAESLAKVADDSLLEELFAVPMGMHEWQLRNQISNMETPEMKYVQCLREISVRVGALKSLAKDKDELVAEIKEKEQAEETPSKKSELGLLDLSLFMLVKKVKDTAEEILVFKDMKKECGEFTKKQINDAQEGYWRHRFGIEMKAQLIAHGRPSEGHVKESYRMGFKPVEDTAALMQELTREQIEVNQKLLGESNGQTTN